MWIYTQHGIASIVEDKNDTDVMWVRTRNKLDLDTLRNLTPALQNRKIRQWKNRDYEWRIKTTRAEFADLMGAVVTNLDYDNFKNRAHHTIPHNSRALYGVYNATYQATDLYEEPEPPSRWYDDIVEEPRMFDDFYVDPIPEQVTIFDKFADWLDAK